MKLIYEYGFSVDADTKRIYLNQGTVIGFNQSIPQGSDGVTKGTDTGVVIAKNAKIGYNNDINIVYNDIKGKPYTGKVNIYGQLPHDENGKLLVDSVGAIKEYKNGLAYTVYDALAMDPLEVIKPGACTLKSADAVAVNKVNVEFSEPKTGTKPFEFVGRAVGGGKVITGPLDEVAVKGSYFGALQGLTGGTDYQITVFAKNEAGDGDDSNAISVKTPDGVAPPKVIIHAVEELDKAVYFVFDAQNPEPNEGYWVNIDDKEDRQLQTSPNGQGYLKATVDGLNNDQTYSMYLYAKNNGVKGDKSDVVEVTPAAPEKPYRPVITSLRNDQLYIYIEFAPTDNNGVMDSGPLDITGWEVYCSVNNGDPEVYKINDGAARSYKFVYANKDGDFLQIWVKAFNEVGESDPSYRSTLTVGEVHLIDGGNRSSDGVRQFVVFTKSSNVIVNYDCRFDVFMVGGGGGGRGQLVPYGMGGNGGGGENQVAYYEFLKQGVYPVTIGGGAEYGGSQPGGDTKFPAIEMTVKGGGTAQGKADGTPSTPKTKVPTGFEKCPDFAWNPGVSDFVSGYMEWDKNSQPNGKLFGQGGGGTNGTSGVSRAGNGQDGIIVISYPLPPLLPINIRASKQAAKTLSVIFNNPQSRVPAKWIVQPYINDEPVVNKGKIDSTTVYLFLLDGSNQSVAVQTGDKVYARIYPDGFTYFAQTETIIW